MAPGGTAALVEMRGELLTRTCAPSRTGALIDYDLLHLLRSWFNRGFLRLERIDWRTSAIVLEKLIEYEAVHADPGLARPAPPPARPTGAASRSSIRSCPTSRSSSSRWRSRAA